MGVDLLPDDAVGRLRSLSGKYHLPVSGTSYGGELWNRSAHPVIEAEVELVIGRLELALPPHYTPKRRLRDDWKISREFVRTTFGW